MAKVRRPRVFVGSSGESLRYAYAVQKTLAPLGVDVTVWQEDVFKISSFTLESLSQAAKAHDFAVFIFADDDVVIKRKHRRKTVRDNVLFELGLFMGGLGRERTFVATPKGVDLSLPSDLAGWNVARYNPLLKSAVAAMSGACRQIRAAIHELGNFDPAAQTRAVSGAAPIIERASGVSPRRFDRSALSAIPPVVIRPIGGPSPGPRTHRGRPSRPARGRKPPQPESRRKPRS